MVKLGCVHEMHAYSRIVWRVAEKYGATGHTVQHAALSSGKRWYFSYPEERAAGLALPSVFYVFDDRTASLLRPWFETTRFVLGCSSRYVKWASHEPVSAPTHGQVLFAGALANFDNEVLFNALLNVSRKRPSAGAVVLRLHPAAQLGFRQKALLRYLLWKNLMALSNRTDLVADLAQARLVVGMSTTVLEEAILFGLPAVQITDEKYLLFVDVSGISGARQVNWKDLALEGIDPGLGEIDTSAARERFGLDQPVVTYERLFSDIDLKALRGSDRYSLETCKTS